MEDQLNALEAEFNQWRQTSRKGTRTPNHLRNKLQSLIPYFSKATLARRLGIHYELINQLSLQDNLAGSDAQAAFVEIDTGHPIQSETLLEINFHHLNMAVKGNINDISELIKRIIPSEAV